MFKDINGEIPFYNSVKAAISFITDKIISSDSDLIGITFFGTGQQKNLNDFSNIYVYQDLDVPDAQRIIDLEKLLAPNFDFKETFGGHVDSVPFGDVLWTCSTIFSCNNFFSFKIVNLIIYKLLQ